MGVPRRDKKRHVDSAAARARESTPWLSAYILGFELVFEELDASGFEIFSIVVFPPGPISSVVFSFVVPTGANFLPLSCLPFSLPTARGAPLPLSRI
jgi:hypothetical protein